MSFLSNFKTEVQEKVVEDCFELHQGKSAANTIARPNAERKVSIRIDRPSVFFTETIRVERFGLWVIFRVMMNIPDRNEESSILLEMQSLVVVLQIIFFDAEAVSDLWRIFGALDLSLNYYKNCLPVQQAISLKSLKQSDQDISFLEFARKLSFCHQAHCSSLESLQKASAECLDLLQVRTLGIPLLLQPN